MNARWKYTQDGKVVHHRPPCTHTHRENFRAVALMFYGGWEETGEPRNQHSHGENMKNFMQGVIRTQNRTRDHDGAVKQPRLPQQYRHTYK